MLPPSENIHQLSDGCNSEPPNDTSRSNIRYPNKAETLYLGSLHWSTWWWPVPLYLHWWSADRRLWPSRIMDRSCRSQQMAGLSTAKTWSITQLNRMADRVSPWRTPRPHRIGLLHWPLMSSTLHVSSSDWTNRDSFCHHHQPTVRRRQIISQWPSINVCTTHSYSATDDKVPERQC